MFCQRRRHTDPVALIATTRRCLSPMVMHRAPSPLPARPLPAVLHNTGLGYVTRRRRSLHLTTQTEAASMVSPYAAFLDAFLIESRRFQSTSSSGSGSRTGMRRMKTVGLASDDPWDDSTTTSMVGIDGDPDGFDELVLDEVDRSNTASNNRSTVAAGKRMFVKTDIAPAPGFTHREMKEDTRSLRQVSIPATTTGVALAQRMASVSDAAHPTSKRPSVPLPMRDDDEIVDEGNHNDADDVHDGDDDDGSADSGGSDGRSALKSDPPIHTPGSYRGGPPTPPRMPSQQKKKRSVAANDSTILPGDAAKYRWPEAFKKREPTTMPRTNRHHRTLGTPSSDGNNPKSSFTAEFEGVINDQGNAEEGGLGMDESEIVERIMELLPVDRAVPLGSITWDLPMELIATKYGSLRQLLARHEGKLLMMATTAPDLGSTDTTAAKSKDGSRSSSAIEDSHGRETDTLSFGQKRLVGRRNVVEKLIAQQQAAAQKSNTKPTEPQIKEAAPKVQRCLVSVVDSRPVLRTKGALVDELDAVTDDDADGEAAQEQQRIMALEKAKQQLFAGVPPPPPKVGSSFAQLTAELPDLPSESPQRPSRKEPPRAKRGSAAVQPSETDETIRTAVEMVLQKELGDLPPIDTETDKSPTDKPRWKRTLTVPILKSKLSREISALVRETPGRTLTSWLRRAVEWFDISGDGLRVSQYGTMPWAERAPPIDYQYREPSAASVRDVEDQQDAWFEELDLDTPEDEIVLPTVDEDEDAEGFQGRLVKTLEEEQGLPPPVPSGVNEQRLNSTPATLSAVHSYMVGMTPPEMADGAALANVQRLSNRGGMFDELVTLVPTFWVAVRFLRPSIAIKQYYGFDVSMAKLLQQYPDFVEFSYPGAASANNTTTGLTLDADMLLRRATLQGTALVRLVEGLTHPNKGAADATFSWAQRELDDERLPKLQRATIVYKRDTSIPFIPPEKPTLDALVKSLVPFIPSHEWVAIDELMDPSCDKALPEAVRDGDRIANSPPQLIETFRECEGTFWYDAKERRVRLRPLNVAPGATEERSAEDSPVPKSVKWIMDTVRLGTTAELLDLHENMPDDVENELAEAQITSLEACVRMHGRLFWIAPYEVLEQRPDDPAAPPLSVIRKRVRRFSGSAEIDGWEHFSIQMIQNALRQVTSAVHPAVILDQFLSDESLREVLPETVARMFRTPLGNRVLWQHPKSFALRKKNVPIKMTVYHSPSPQVLFEEQAEPLQLTDGTALADDTTSAMKRRTDDEAAAAPRAEPMLCDGAPIEELCSDEEATQKAQEEAKRVAKERRDADKKWACHLCKDRFKKDSMLLYHLQHYHEVDVIPAATIRAATTASAGDAGRPNTNDPPTSEMKPSTTVPGKVQTDDTSAVATNTNTTAKKLPQTAIHCPRCNAPFRFESSLRYHMRMAHNEELGEKAPDAKPRTPWSIIGSAEADKRRLSPEDEEKLKANAATGGIPEEELPDMPFVCLVCKLGFRFESALKRHMKEHETRKAAVEAISSTNYEREEEEKLLKKARSGTLLLKSQQKKVQAILAARKKEEEEARGVIAVQREGGDADEKPTVTEKTAEPKAPPPKGSVSASSSALYREKATPDQEPVYREEVWIGLPSRFHATLSLPAEAFTLRLPRRQVQLALPEPTISTTEASDPAVLQEGIQSGWGSLEITTGGGSVNDVRSA